MCGCRTQPTPPPVPWETPTDWPRTGVAELGGVGLAIGHVDLEPVNRQQSPPAQPRPRAVPNSTSPAVGEASPATGPHVRSKISANPQVTQPRRTGKNSANHMIKLGYVALAPGAPPFSIAARCCRWPHPPTTPHSPAAATNERADRSLVLTSNRVTTRPTDQQ